MRFAYAVRGAFALLCVILLASPCLAARKRPQVPTEAGEKIYRDGILSSGEPLRGQRDSAPVVQGQAAACVNCHRRSGLGELEGRTLVPPTTAKYLYHPRSKNRQTSLQSAALTMAEPGVKPELLQEGDRSAYNDETLARAIREGIGPEGRPLNYLMPRFQIDDSDMASLIAYLKHLSSRPSPGVGDETLEFATIITPDADPVKRRGMLDVLEHFFGKQNVYPDGKSPPAAQRSHRFTPYEHQWQLQVWQLTGAPESWGAQLDERLNRRPVFAVISGLGGRTWEPVHQFCERSHVPCLFPNVDLPVDAEQDFYDLYFSKGVLLEAELVAERLQRDAEGATPTHPRRVVQVFRRGDIGEAAAARLRSVLSSPAWKVVDRPVEAAADSNHLEKAWSDTAADDALVLWLGPGDLKALPSQPPAVATVFVSGIIGGLEQAPLPDAWRKVALMTYPFDLPNRRAVEMDYPLGWMRFKHIAVVDERTQTNTYVACLTTAETVSMLGEDLVQDHLLETLEMHLGTRLVNGYYAHLTLAPGQRFASKGGFVARFAEEKGMHLIADGEWTVP